MLAYRYDTDTKEFIGLQYAQKDPLGKGYLLPANCTFKEPPDKVDGYIQIFDLDNNSWEQVRDHRDHYEVREEDFTFDIVKYIGEAKEGYIFVADGIFENYLVDPDRYKIVDHQVIDIIDTEEYKRIKANEREASFNKSFFNTSLGYVRRAVTMANGTTKDFLSDLLPVISMGVQSGSQVNILTYDKPPFDHDIEDWEEYQHQVVVTPQFIQECFMQLSNDFLPINEEDE